MKPLLIPLLRQLSDGRFHSGEDLARQFGVSRATIWQSLSEAASVGVQVFRVRGRGYRLDYPLDLLDGRVIAETLGHVSPFQVEVMDSVESTNSLLLERARQGDIHGECIAAELQTRGRGRQGRVWHSGIAGALTFSVGWQFKGGVTALSGLSLAAGLAVAQACEALGVLGVKLKWPNDVIHNGRKLAGILIEVQGEMLGPSAAVIGIGLNYRLAPQVQAEIDQAVIDLAGIADPLPSRNKVLAELLYALGSVLLNFEQGGFAPFVADWEARHAYQMKQVQLLLPDRSLVRGVAKGVGTDGSLQIFTTGGGTMRFNVGEVSLRGA